MRAAPTSARKCASDERSSGRPRAAKRSSSGEPGGDVARDLDGVEPAPRGEARRAGRSRRTTAGRRARRWRGRRGGGRGSTHGRDVERRRPWPGRASRGRAPRRARRGRTARRSTARSPPRPRAAGRATRAPAASAARASGKRPTTWHSSALVISMPASTARRAPAAALHGGGVARAVVVADGDHARALHAAAARRSPGASSRRPRRARAPCARAGLPGQVVTHRVLGPWPSTAQAPRPLRPRAYRRPTTSKVSRPTA